MQTSLSDDYGLAWAGDNSWQAKRRIATWNRPDLPGCVALAETEDEVLAEMRQAIELHLAGLREDGQPIPHPSTVAATVITLDAA